MGPETRYARSGDVHIAYQVVGDGPIDLLWVPTWIWQVEHVWEDPTAASMLQHAGSIRYTRGLITIVDRKKLGHASCQCHRIIRGEYRRLLG